MGIEDNVFGPQKDRERTAVANQVDCMVMMPIEDDIEQRSEKWKRHKYRGWVCRCGYHTYFLAGIGVHDRQGCRAS